MDIGLKILTSGFGLRFGFSKTIFGASSKATWQVLEGGSSGGGTSENISDGGTGSVFA